MAELLGLVSGGAGLMALSIQLLDSAQKLKAFYSQFRNAPQTLETLSSDLETLALMLQELERSRQKTGHSGDVLLQRCILRVEGQVDIIDSLVLRLEMRLDRCRTFGKLATAFLEPEIRTALEGLEGAKSNLLFGRQIYMVYVLAYRSWDNAANELTSPGRGARKMHWSSDSSFVKSKHYCRRSPCVRHPPEKPSVQPGHLFREPDLLTLNRLLKCCHHTSRA